MKAFMLLYSFVVPVGILLRSFSSVLASFSIASHSTLDDIREWPPHQQLHNNVEQAVSGCVSVDIDWCCEVLSLRHTGADSGRHHRRAMVYRSRLVPWRALSRLSRSVWFTATDDQLPGPFGQDLDHLFTRGWRFRYGQLDHGSPRPGDRAGHGDHTGVVGRGRQGRQSRTITHFAAIVLTLP